MEIDRTGAGTGTGTTLGTVKGGAEPKLTIAATLTKTAGNFLCPSTEGWDADVAITSPHAVFVGN